MNRRTIVSLVFAALYLPTLGMAQTEAAVPAPLGAVKVAWLNLEQAIFNCDEGRAKFAEVQKFVESKNQELQGSQKELETLKNQLQVQGAKLTDEARADLENEIELKEVLLQRFQEDTQREIDNRRVRVTNEIGRKMMPIIEKIAKEKTLDAVVYLNPSRDGYVNPNLVITEEVIKAYNLAHPPAAAKPAAKP